PGRWAAAIVLYSSFIVHPSSFLAAADLPAGAARRIGDARFLHAGPVRDFAPSPDGTAVASTDGGAVYGWDAATGRRRFRTPLDADERCVWVGWAGEKPRAVVYTAEPTSAFRSVEFDPRTGRALRP